MQLVVDTARWTSWLGVFVGMMAFSTEAYAQTCPAGYPVDCGAISTTCCPSNARCSLLSGIVQCVAIGTPTQVTGSEPCPLSLPVRTCGGNIKDQQGNNVPTAKCCPSGTTRCLNGACGTNFGSKSSSGGGFGSGAPSSGGSGSSGSSGTSGSASCSSAPAPGKCSSVEACCTSTSCFILADGRKFTCSGTQCTSSDMQRVIDFCDTGSASSSGESGKSGDDGEPGGESCATSPAMTRPAGIGVVILGPLVVLATIVRRRRRHTTSR